MKKAIKALGITVIIIILFSNTPPIRYILSYIWDFNHYKYSNASASYIRIEREGPNVDGVRASFKNFLSSNDVPPQDTILYRTFWRNPLAFWRYWS